jgi:hypothetical protein
MTKPNSTEIIFVVDRSASMASIAEAMKSGFEEFISKQKGVDGECRVTLTRFDDHYDVVYTGRPLTEVASLELEPRGMTALLDAVGRTINDTGSRLARMKESDRPSQVLFVIITDGQENASREFNRERVFRMITHQREKYNWEFIFLGANQDSIASARDLGIHVSNAVCFNADVGGTKGLMRGLSANVANYRSSGKGTMENLYNQASYNASLDPNAKDSDIVSAIPDIKVDLSVKASTPKSTP